MVIRMIPRRHCKKALSDRRHCNVYLAACAPDGGVYHCTLADQRLTVVKFYPLDRPMYLCIDGGKLWVLLREPFPGSTDSGLMSFDIATDGSLENPTQPIHTDGRVACHLSAWGGKLYAVNYLSGNVVRFDENGVDAMDTHEGRGQHPTRQEAPHSHFVRPSADGKYLYAVDLGVDKIYTYDRELNVLSTASVPAGEGCRHLDYSPDGRYIYCVNELGSSVTVFEAVGSELRPLDTYPALPADFDEKSTAAAIRVSEDGRTLYVSHRGHDSICAFDITEGGKALASPVWTKVGGVSPRDFLIVGGTAIVTNEKTDNVTLFAVDGKRLHKLEQKLSMPGPLCVVAE